MLAIALLGGCLIDTDLWETRRAALSAEGSEGSVTDSGSTSEDGTRDADGDGTPAASDCDDADAQRHPGADELCDGVDQDCDGSIDETPVDGVDAWADADGDGQGAGNRVTACLPAAGWAGDDRDCDDADASVYVGAPERLDGRSNDCANPGPDELLASDADLVLVGEAPGDGFGAALVSVPDLDGDGTAELLAGASGTGVVYLLDVSVTGTALGAEGGRAPPSATPPPAVADAPTRGGWDGTTTPWSGPGPDGAPVLLLPRSGDVEVLGLAGGGFVRTDTWGVSAASLTVVEGADGLPRALVGTHDGTLRLLDTAWNDAAGRSLTGLGGAGEDVIVGAAGDVDDDGAGDVLVGLPASDRVWLLPLDAVGTGDALASFLGASERAGAAVGGVGDLDGDGWGDLAIGAPANDARAIDAGRLYLPRGPFRGTVNLDSVGMVIEGRGGRVETGRAFAAGNAFRGNTNDEIVVPVDAYDYESQEDVGGVFVFSDFEARILTIGDAASRIVGPSMGAHFGRAVSMSPGCLAASGDGAIYVFKAN